MNKLTRVQLGNLYEKRFEVFCIEKEIPIYTPVQHQSMEDYIIVHKNDYKSINVKYRTWNSRDRCELQLISKAGGKDGANYLTNIHLDYIILCTDMFPNFFFCIDLWKIRDSDKINSKYPSLSLSKETIMDYKM
jgi:hypothetical protein